MSWTSPLFCAPDLLFIYDFLFIRDTLIISYLFHSTHSQEDELIKLEEEEDTLVLNKRKFRESKNEQLVEFWLPLCAKLRELGGVSWQHQEIGNIMVTKTDSVPYHLILIIQDIYYYHLSSIHPINSSAICARSFCCRG